jgi:hypothetical protein
MNPYYFIIEAEPQSGNPLGAHVSRAVIHLWILSTGIDTARTKGLDYLTTNLWEILEEKEASSPSQEEIDNLTPDKASSYGIAQSEGLSATFNYWHK